MRPNPTSSVFRQVLVALGAGLILLAGCGSGGPSNNGALCQVKNGGCDTNATCTVENGAVACACNTGYTGNGKSCADVNECANGTATCGAHALCTNTPGSYTCACVSGYQGDGHTCTPSGNICMQNNGGCDPNAMCQVTPQGKTCTCNPGYTGDGVTCTDINECAFMSPCAPPNQNLMCAGPCDAHATCTNTPGSFMCTCEPGYTGPGTYCADINECTNGTAHCDPHAKCTNTPGSFTCTCFSGYMGDGTTCADLQPCEDGTAQCDPNASCKDSTDTPGSYTCTCHSGYTTTDQGHTCTSIDFCGMTPPPCDPNATCMDTPGSFKCNCNTGYNGNGFDCVPNDPCQLPNYCDRNATCANGVCMCKAGFMGTGTPGQCMEVDACTQTPGPCDMNATCNYTAATGTYTCTCNPGYTGDGTTCSLINCSVGNGGCPPNARCSATPGTAQCTCDPGTIGDGLHSCTGAPLLFSAGDSHACAVTTTNGALWCWGANADGRLGNGTTADSSTPQEVLQTNVITPWVSVSAGVTHTCGIDSMNQLWCWGDNTDNALGPVTDSASSNVTQPELVGSSTNWTQVSAGGHFTCGLKSDGSLQCWGLGSSGQLGDGTFPATSTAQFHTVQTRPGFGWIFVSAGPGHACGIQTDGSLWCWGEDDHGQLGQSYSGAAVSTPTQVTTATDWVAVSEGNSHTCGIHADNSVQCWGANALGQLGRQTTQPDPLVIAPLFVPGGQAGANIWSGVSAGGDHTCATTPDGTMYCFGLDADGELGDNAMGTGVYSTSLVEVGMGQSWYSASAGGEHTCAVKLSDGTLWCWGADGISTDANQPTPTQVMNIQ